MRYIVNEYLPAPRASVNVREETPPPPPSHCLHPLTTYVRLFPDRIELYVWMNFVSGLRDRGAPPSVHPGSQLGNSDPGTRWRW